MCASRVHAEQSCPDALGKSWQVLASFGQRKLPLIAPMRSAPVDAPGALVRRIESDAQALAVSMQAAGAKCAYVGACIGKSEGYVSRLRAGKREIPDKLVTPLCWATGSNLLAQVRALHAALDGAQQSTVTALASLLRAA